MFTIQSIYRLDSDLVTVKVTMNAKAWLDYRNKGQLGSLYGVDISNQVYRLSGVKASCPIVDDHAKSKNGVKVLELTYADAEWVEIDNVIRVDFAKRCRAA
ncbi:unnamed protein product [Sphagnum jensenii]|uniref:Uncharacterized protein n=1 Tax=Sphagnum jensenii TaxID=128206 RepID=A0ABP0V6N8_9BRYO